MKNTKPTPKQKSQVVARPKKQKLQDIRQPQAANIHETLDETTQLTQDVPEDFRDVVGHTFEQDHSTASNWSQAQDRSEDFMEGRDPLVQEPELDAQIPSELIQERAYHLYERRGGSSRDDLGDWLEAERQLRQEYGSRKNP